MTSPTHVHHADVTFDLLDPGNALYHANHLVLADRARGAAFEALGYPVHELWGDGYTLMVRSVTTEYLQPVFAGAKLAVLTSMHRHSARSLRVMQRFVHRQQLEATGLSRGGIVQDLADDSLLPPLCRIELRLVCANMKELCLSALPYRLAAAVERELEAQPATHPSHLHVGVAA